MGMRPISRMRSTVTLVGAFTALVSLMLTVVSCVFAYLATRSDTTFNIRDAFLAVFGLLLVISINS